MFYGDFVFKFFSLDSILFALFDILTLFQGRLIMAPILIGIDSERFFMWMIKNESRLTVIRR
ncbi:hypothetical protein [Leptospira kirschneri]|uniref:hypothetical protein n=1 Tax=Leptospira kirschneri TaxID=29507 RepID=UPI0035690B7B